MSAAHAKIPWATVDPDTLSGSNPAQLYNLVNGEWTLTKKSIDVVDPLNGEAFIKMPDTQVDELQPFRDSLSGCPKTGLHNPFKSPERYLTYGAVSHRAAAEMWKPEVEDFFAKCIQRVAPKSYAQAMGEVRITRQFFENFSGDQVRFLARGFTVPGDYAGQQSQGVRYPFGPVALVTPFNFPLEIMGLQIMGALYMGNKVVNKNCARTSLVSEQFLRMLHHCGMPLTDADHIHGSGEVMGELLKHQDIRMTQFTGSSRVAEHLAVQLRGKIKIEDAGFDWKILGPDAESANLDYVAYWCDQDAYACQGQKCSAQSILFAHENWTALGLYEKMKAQASTRSMSDLTIGPVLTVTTDTILNHMNSLLKINGSKLLFGGKELANHSIPKQYGAVEPTAVFVPLKELVKPENFALCTTEIFGPFQVVTEYGDADLDTVLDACNRMSHHLTAGVVSSDPKFTHKVIANTVNGTTYTGIRARTTGAPQNHWFGPAGDPRGAGIGSPEAIKLVWSCHREVIQDNVIPDGWTMPKAS